MGYLDEQGMAGDSTLHDIANTYPNQSAHANPYYTGLSSVEEAMLRINNSTNLDPRKIGSVTVFSNSSQTSPTTGVIGGSFASADNSNQPLSAAIVTSSFAKSDLRVALQYQSTTSYDTQAYKHKTLWVNHPQFGQARAVGWLGDGTFAVGTPSGVKAVVDVRAGDANVLSGSVRSTFENTHDG